MEEESLLKERLQAITDKRRIREDISWKRREIEEEKLKLQYIKKKSLREQWLMDGLQSEEEQEAMKVQAQDEQQRTAQLQSNILRMEKEIEELEAQELDISANEEEILRRLKEVERTTEDIIKELSTDLHSDLTSSSPLPEGSLSDIFIEQPPRSPAPDPGPQEPKKATFAMEISVELNKRTGKTQVISTASVTPEIVQGKGLKVYEDGRKSVYALPPGDRGEEVAEMTPTDVEELLRQATDWTGDVQYHQPVYSAPYTGTSRPSTPRTSSKTTSPSSVYGKRIETPSTAASRGESRMEVYPGETEESTCNIPTKSPVLQPNYNYATLGSIKTSFDAASPTQPVYKKVETSPLQATHRYELDLIERSMNLDRTSPFYTHSIKMDEISQSKTPSPALSCTELGTEVFQEEMESDLIPTKSPTQNIGQNLHSINNPNAPLVSVRASSEGMPIPTQLIYKNIETSPLLATHKYDLDLTERSVNLHRTSLYADTIKKSDISQSKTPSPALSHGESRMEAYQGESHTGAQNINIQISPNNRPNAALVSVRASSEGMPTPIQTVYKNQETSPLRSTHRYEMDLIERSMNLDRSSPTYTESIPNSLVDELDPGAVTMIFMGYERADEDEEDSIHAEVVVIGNSDEEDLNVEDTLSYHPNGYTSKVFQPVVGLAKVTGCGDHSEDLQWDDSLPHKPTFMHRSGKSAICLQERPINGRDKENMESCSTER